ncbi:response regulator transcription factor [Paraburkholderia tropica]|uniref:response regulator transcription factor n=1 Tax=Paraburkholderia tropica TaxID=92647 RepID=UPI003D2D363D
MRIGVLDVDPDDTNFICRTLRTAGHTCRALTGKTMLADEFFLQQFDLLVLDWKTAHQAGSRAPDRHGHPPVLFLVNRDDETSIREILNSGAVDFIEKPISKAVLVARVALLSRRASQPQQPAREQTFGEYNFDLTFRRVSVGGRPVTLTLKEFNLALLLFQNMNRPLSRAHIRDMIWKQVDGMSSRTLDTHVAMLRVKLGLRPEKGYQLAPVYGYGYRLDCVVEEPASDEEQKRVAKRTKNTCTTAGP